MAPRTRLLTSIGLLDLSLVLLWLGRFVRFDDTSGFGSDDWIPLLGLLGFLAAGDALLLAWPDRMARRAVGLQLLGIAGLAVVLQRFTSTSCSGADNGGECDLAGLEGLVWAAGAFVLVVLAIVVLEVLRHRSRQRAASASAEATR